MSSPSLGAKPALTFSQAAENLEKARITLLEFLETELQIGFEFSALAAEYFAAGKKASGKRNLRAAKAAYDAILKFLPKSRLNYWQARHIEEAAARLKATFKTRKPLSLSKSAP